MSARVTAKGRPKATSNSKSPDVDDVATATQVSAGASAGVAAGVPAADTDAVIGGLKSQLAAARAHIAQLEQRQAEILSRLDDIIGALESLPPDEV